MGRRGEGAYVLLKCRRLSVTIGALRPSVLTVSHARARRLRSAAVQSQDDRLRLRHSAIPERVKDDRMPSRGCESNNGILVHHVKDHSVNKYTA